MAWDSRLYDCGLDLKILGESQIKTKMMSQYFIKCYKLFHLFFFSFFCFFLSFGVKITNHLHLHLPPANPEMGALKMMHDITFT